MQTRSCNSETDGLDVHMAPAEGGGHRDTYVLYTDSRIIRQIISNCVFHTGADMCRQTAVSVENIVVW